MDLYTGFARMIRRAMRRSIGVGLGMLALAGAFAQPVPPMVGADVQRSGPAAKTTSELRLVDTRLAHPAIVLAPLTEADKTSLGNGGADKRLNIGAGRALPAPYADALASALHWTTLADGGQAALFTVRSPDAAAVRLQIVADSLPEGVELRFFSPQTPAKASAAYGEGQLFRDLAAQQKAEGAPARLPAGMLWSPAIPGDTIAVEVYAPAAVDPRALRFAAPRLSHLFTAPDQQDFTKRLSEIGNSGSCNIDVACAASSISAATVASVAKYIFSSSEGFTALCSGTLLNDTAPADQIPYFLTANHCISSQAEAASVELYWFFERESCGGPDPTSVTTQTGGATLLSTGATSDYTLLRLNQAPPAGVGFSGWTAAAVPAGTDVIGLHHPAGDLKKISFGQMNGFAEYLQAVDGSGSHLQVQWSQGTTEGGSSGSGLWATISGQPYLVGNLHGGTASCDNPSGADYYGRFDLTFPNIQSFLAPAATDYTQVWWDAGKSGQAVQVLQRGNTIFGAWYLYDPAGQGLWVTFTGALANNVMQAELRRFHGPALGAPWDPAAVSSTVVGNGTLTFDSAASARFDYILSGVSGHLDLTPFDPAATGSYTGVWWEPAKSGQGVQFLQNGNQLSGAWYLYDESGNGMWVTFVGNLSGSTMTTTLFRFVGPSLGAPWDASQVEGSPVGTLRIDLLSATAVRFAYTVNGASGTLNLEPFQP